MPFMAIHVPERSRTDWDAVTHIRLINGRQPSTKAGMDRWRTLNRLADTNGVVPLAKVFVSIKPERNLGDLEKSLKSDLRCYSNPITHGNNRQNKGWIELGYVADHSKNSGSE